ncbi:MAG: T9SS type A sorting domain-containing protein, partial [Bacteroidaceae bacterium]
IQPHVFRGGVTYYRSYVDSVAETVFQIGRIECNVYMKRHPYEWYQITIPVKVDVLPRVPKLRVLDMTLDTEFPNYDNYDATFEIIATGDYREGTLYVLPYVGYDVFFPNVEMPYVAKACVSIGESVVVSLGNNYGHTDSNIIRIDDSLTSIPDVNLSNGVQITQNGRGIDIMVSDSRITKLSVFDLKGKEVYQKNVVEKGSLSIDLQKGIYILVFKDTMNNKTRKKINII